MRKPALSCIAVASVLILATLAFQLYEPSIGFSLFRTGTPSIEFQSQIDLGEREVGEQVIVPYTIYNRGNGLLVIDTVRTNCACAGMDTARDGTYWRVESLQLEPGGHADLVMRFSVPPVAVGTPITNSVRFRTNDPKQPEAEISACVRRVVGGVRTYPDAIVVGTVSIGTTLRRTIEVWDNVRDSRDVEHITTTHPERVQTQWTPVKIQPPVSRGKPDGLLLGTIDVTINTEQPGDINAWVRIHVAGRTHKPDEVAIVGCVRQPFEIYPSSLTLPRQTSAGPIFSSQVSCECTGGQPFELETEMVPEQLTVEIVAADRPERRVLRITWHPIGESVRTRTREVIRFRARAETLNAVLELPVYLQRSEAAHAR